MHYVYIIRCNDGTLYCGYTLDIKRRVAEHNEGKGAHYTKHRGPVRLVYSEKLSSKRKALQREMEIKKMSRKEKFELIGVDEKKSSM